MFKRCLLGSIILHIVVIAGVGICTYKAQLELDMITYFRLVTDIHEAGSPVDRNGFQAVNAEGAHGAATKTNIRSAGSNLPLTVTNPTARGSPAPDSGKPGTEMVKEDFKPAMDNGPGQSGANSGTSTGGSFLTNPGTGFDAGNSDGSGIPGDGAQVISPRRVYSPNPAYPTIAKRNNWQGLVILRVLIKTDGAIGDITIFKSSGFEILDRSALQTVKKWRYQPALRMGEAVECYLRIPVRFQLEE